jgi:hypothetical protein
MNWTHDNPTGKRTHIDDPFPRGPMGRKQKAMLGYLRERGHWSANCGWIVGTHSNTVRLLESLIPRGFVVRAVEPTGWTGVAASIYGRERTVYRLRKGRENIV